MAIKIKGSTVIDSVGGAFKGTFKTVTTQTKSTAATLPENAWVGETYWVEDAGALFIYTGSDWQSI